MKKLNNQGFSLVELIIVIAIMAVLIGVLAPTYLGQVSKAKVSTDLQNAQEVATSIAVKCALADNAESLSTTWAEVTAAVTDIQIPEVKAASGYKFIYKYENSVVKVGVGKPPAAGATAFTDCEELYPTRTTTTGSTWKE